MDAALQVLQVAESFLAQAETKLDKLGNMKLSGHVERIESVFAKTEKLQERIRGWKYRVLKLFAILVNRTPNREYQHNSHKFTFYLDCVEVSYGRKPAKYINMWEFVDTHWSYELFQKMIQEACESLEKLPRIHESQNKELDELTKLCEEIAKLA